MEVNGLSVNDLVTDALPTIGDKNKKKSTVEKQLETNLTYKVTSPITVCDIEPTNTSRYGRARKKKSDADFYITDKSLSKVLKSTTPEELPSQSPFKVYKMHASKSPLKTISPQREINANSDEEVTTESTGIPQVNESSFIKKVGKVYIRRDLIQGARNGNDKSINLSPNRPSSHLNSILERSTEKYTLSESKTISQRQNGVIDNASVVKTLVFDDTRAVSLSGLNKALKADLNTVKELETECAFKLGDLVWSRVGTHPFWPSVVTRDPLSGTFIKKKAFGRGDSKPNVIHVTFFGDRGRRGWIVESMLLKFKGILDFEAEREKITPEAKKKDPKLYSAYLVSEKKQKRWNIAVEEAEDLLRKGLSSYTDILLNLSDLQNKCESTPKRKNKGHNSNGNISLSESLYDSLFSGDNSQCSDKERATSRSFNKSLDVSDVVTACLNDMATKTGITKIKKQSHMDRWLQKAKCKTPEKVTDDKTIGTSGTTLPDEANMSCDISTTIKIKNLNDDLTVDKRKVTDSVLYNGIYEDLDCNKKEINIVTAENTSDLSTSLNPTTPVKKTEEIQNKIADIMQNVNEDNDGNVGPITSTPNRAQNNDKSCDSKKPQKANLNLCEAKNDKSPCIKENNVPNSNDPDFLRYVDIRRCTLLEEHPSLTEEDILNYLHRTWMYEENLKTDETKKIEKFQSNLVNVLEALPEQPADLKTRNNNTVSESTILATGDSNRILDNKNDSVESTCDNPADKSIPLNLSDDNYQSRSSDSSTSEEEEQNSKHVNGKVEKNIATKCSDPDFLKYVDVRRDALMDENPSLTEEDVLCYLHRTWVYEESRKTDEMKNDDVQQSHLVKGLGEEVLIQPKKYKKRVKHDKDIKISKNNHEPGIREKYSRKGSAKSYFSCESDSDEEEFKNRKYENTFQSHPTNGKLPKIAAVYTQNGNEVIVDEEAQHLNDNEMMNDEGTEQSQSQKDAYLAQLTAPKPNLFKGLARERVCEICEKPAVLVKCRGLCGGMFHPDCVKKQAEEPDMTEVRKGRKKKKIHYKKRIKVESNTSQEDPKVLNGTDSDNNSDDKSQDVSTLAKEDTTITAEVSCPITTDVVDFEAILASKMTEILESTQDYCDVDSLYSSDDERDWDNTVAGKCEIVDVKLRTKSVSDTFINNWDNFKCNDCQKYEKPLCFVCKSTVSPKTKSEVRQRCNLAHCYKYYHIECLDHWPQTQFNLGQKRNNLDSSEAMMCPRHVCHTCVCDDPRGCQTRFSGDKLARCVRCPAVYHSFTKCLPAGSKILTASQIICPRHYEQRPGQARMHVNTAWCFICTAGGTLICCEYCPTSFHAECLNISPPDGNYMCEDCETGRLPLYGEMVWVKLGNYRWWPGIILHPRDIPSNIYGLKHAPGEFVVRFFGANDHYWINRGRVFPFQDGDSGNIKTQRSNIDTAFIKAIEQAEQASKILKTLQPNQEESDIASSLLPPRFVKLKVNKPYGSLVHKKLDSKLDEANSFTQCDCNPDVEDPCGPDTHCLNRMLFTECGPSCRAGDRCNNRSFEKRRYPKLVPYRTSWRGWGLKTLEDIKKGQFVIEYVGELIDEEEFQRRMRRKHETRDENYYFLTLDNARMIDAGPKGNVARFMNHCCEPNCETQKWTVLGDIRVGLFALYDIPAGNEVNFNYNLECASVDKKMCLCGAKRCSGYIGAKPKQDDSTKKLKPKRIYKKRSHPKPESPYQSPKTKIERKSRTSQASVKPKELTEIEKDLLIIQNATNGLSDSDSTAEKDRMLRLSVERLDAKDEAVKSNLKHNGKVNALKRKRVSFSTEDIIIYDSADNSPSVKRLKMCNGDTNGGAGDRAIEVNGGHDET